MKRESGEFRTLFATIIGVSFWGLSGTAAQGLLQIFNFPVIGLLGVRLLSSGTILFAIFRPATPEKKEFFKLLPLALFGFLGSQLTYLVAIQYSNAATATLLQFLFLPIVAGYEALSGVIRWSRRWTLVIGLSVVGTILLVGAVSDGSFQLLVTEIGLVSGLLAAVSAAFYSLSSRQIVREKGPWWLVTWGFLLAGAICFPFGILSLSTYKLPPQLESSLDVIFLVLFVIVFGTMLSYGLFLSGLRKLSATEVGVISSFEPIMAAVAAYVFLGVILSGIQYLGGALILTAVILIAFEARSRNREKILQP
jgi:drug/metabolite transporter (DMT)-like permease